MKCYYSLIVSKQEFTFLFEKVAKDQLENVPKSRRDMTNMPKRM